MRSHWSLGFFDSFDFGLNVFHEDSNLIKLGINIHYFWRITTTFWLASVLSLDWRSLIRFLAISLLFVTFLFISFLLFFLLLMTILSVPVALLSWTFSFTLLYVHDWILDHILFLNRFNLFFIWIASYFFVSPSSSSGSFLLGFRFWFCPLFSAFSRSSSFAWLLFDFNVQILVLLLLHLAARIYFRRFGSRVLSFLRVLIIFTRSPWSRFACVLCLLLLWLFFLLASAAFRCDFDRRLLFLCRFLHLLCLLLFWFLLSLSFLFIFSFHFIFRFVFFSIFSFLFILWSMNDWLDLHFDGICHVNLIFWNIHLLGFALILFFFWHALLNLFTLFWLFGLFGSLLSFILDLYWLRIRFARYLFDVLLFLWIVCVVCFQEFYSLHGFLWTFWLNVNMLLLLWRILLNWLIGIWLAVLRNILVALRLRLGRFGIILWRCLVLGALSALFAVRLRGITLTWQQLFFLFLFWSCSCNRVALRWRAF